jgi:hypothetical protein
VRNVPWVNLRQDRLRTLGYFGMSRPTQSIATKKKGAGGFRRHEAREMRSSESGKSRSTNSGRQIQIDKFKETYLLSAMGLAPKSRRLFTAVRAARAAGILAAAAP